jgi:hypothetical protein
MVTVAMRALELEYLVKILNWGRSGSRCIFTNSDSTWNSFQLWLQLHDSDSTALLRSQKLTMASLKVSKYRICSQYMPYTPTFFSVAPSPPSHTTSTPHLAYMWQHFAITVLVLYYSSKQVTFTVFSSETIRLGILCTGTENSKWVMQ